MTGDTVGSPGSISTKDLMGNTHHQHINIIMKGRRLEWLGHAPHRSDNSMAANLFFRGKPDMCSLLDGLVARGCIIDDRSLAA